MRWVPSATVDENSGGSVGDRPERFELFLDRHLKKEMSDDLAARNPRTYETVPQSRTGRLAGSQYDTPQGDHSGPEAMAWDAHGLQAAAHQPHVAAGPGVAGHDLASLLELRPSARRPGNEASSHASGVQSGPAGPRNAGLCKLAGNSGGRKAALEFPGACRHTFRPIITGFPATRRTGCKITLVGRV